MMYPSPNIVAPLVGAWIEISYQNQVLCLLYVAPLVGAWIEIVVNTSESCRVQSRSPRGSVD